MKVKSKKLLISVALLLASAILLTTASFAWFSMNTEVNMEGIEVEAYSDALFLQISDNESSGFNTEVDLNGDKALLRLVTPIATPLTEAYNISAQPATGRYDGGDGVYYVLGKGTASTNDTYSQYNYLKVDNSTLEAASSLVNLYTATFTETANDEVAVSGTNYFEKIQNGYKPVTVSDGDSVYGYYKSTDLEKKTSGTYAGEDTVYYKLEGGAYIVEPYLTEGTLLTGTYFTITETADPATSDVDPIADLSAATGLVYVKDGNDYVCVYSCTGTEDISDMFVWGRAYSNTLGEPEGNNTLSAIKAASLGNYYYTDTVYLRCALNTNDGTDLKIAEVKIGGKTNDLSEAIRILFVATNGKGEVVTEIYDNGNPSAFDGSLFDKILGNERETVKVDMYVYFDGTDDVAKTALTSAGELNGQSVEVKFTIAMPDYNK